MQQADLNDASDRPATLLDRDPTPDRAPVVEMRGITKAFGPTLANAAVDLVVGRGEVIGLVGGNGAGKSTLMRTLCGAGVPDSGTLAIEGRPIDLAGYDAGSAQRFGIRIVHQELSLCGNLSVAENFFLETPDAAQFLPGWRRAYRRRARAALDEVFPDNRINVDLPVDDLPIGQRQMVEIARAATAPGVKLLILDEPTSSLDPERSRQLRRFIAGRTGKGFAFIFISHKLHEIMDLATRVSVLRSGRLVWAGATGATSIPKLVEAMGGVAEQSLRQAEATHRPASDKVFVSATGPVVAGLGGDLSLRAGEIVGLAGLEGSGQRDFLHAIYEGRRGSVERLGEASFVSGDRQREGIFPFWTVFANIDLGLVARRFALAPARAAGDEAAVRRGAERLRLDAARLPSKIGELSGGNQQKALMARALATGAETILLDDPTRGVDVAAKADCYRAFAQAAAAGRLVVWHSTEDAEFMECDRVLVFSGGLIVRELGRADLSEQALVDASFADKIAATDRGHAADEGRGRLSTLGLRAAPFIALAAVLGAMIGINPTTASVFGLDLLLGPAVALVLIALGQLFVVGGSEIDLGIGAFAGLVNVVSATLLVDSPALGALALAGGLVAYAALGALIQRRAIPAIVVTLGASFIWRGIGYSMQPTPGGSSPDWLTALFGWSVPGVPTTVILIALAGLLALGIDRSPGGVVLRAFGNNPAAMARGGWSPFRYAVLRYAIAGLFGTLAGLTLTAVNTASDINAGGPYTLISIAAVVMGGCTLLGGIVSPAGAVAGAVTLSLIGALLGALDVSTDYNAAVQGLILIAILILRAALGRREAAA